MRNIVEFCETLEAQLLALTPEELLKSLLEGGFGLNESVEQVKRKNPSLSAEEMCILIKNQPKMDGGSFSEKDASGALLFVGYQETEVEEAVRKVYPLKARVVQVKNHGYLWAPHLAAYNFSTGDFTLEAWMKPESAGTLIACKGAPGGYGNGGFLLVYNGNGSFKLATDDGMGFYEVVSSDTLSRDGKWHHILGLRRGGALEIYLDFKKCRVTPGTNRFTPLNVNNSQPLTVAMTNQYQEPFQYYSGLLDEVRVWNMARTYGSREEYDSTLLTGQEKGLCGWWNFDNGDGADGSSAGNAMEIKGDVSFREADQKG